jgi:CheY-like chemotaxis protein
VLCDASGTLTFRKPARVSAAALRGGLSACGRFMPRWPADAAGRGAWCRWRGRRAAASGDRLGETVRLPRGPRRAGTARGGDADPAGCRRSASAEVLRIGSSCRVCPRQACAATARAFDHASRACRPRQSGLLTQATVSADSAGQADGRWAREPDMGKHVLLIEDEENIAEAIRFILSRDGWRVSHVCEGAGAGAARAETGADLVILDHMLPGVSGLEMLAALRADPRTAALPVMMLTAKGHPRDREAAEGRAPTASWPSPLPMPRSWPRCARWRGPHETAAAARCSWRARPIASAGCAMRRGCCRSWAPSCSSCRCCGRSPAPTCG